MREELKNKIIDIIRENRYSSFVQVGSHEIADKIADLIDQDQHEMASGVSTDSALTSFNKLKAAIKTQLALIDEIKAVLNPQPTKAEEVRL